MTLQTISCGIVKSLLISLLVLAGACATIPSASVEASKQIGAGLEKGRAAHIATLNAYYRQLKKDNDEWVVRTFIPKAAANATAALTAACRNKGDTSPACSELGTGDIARLTKGAVDFRDELQRALEKNRDDAAQLINEHYAALIQANAAITGLLASAVDVKEAAREAGRSASASTGVNIDMDMIEAKFNRFLEQAGASGAEVTKVQAKIGEFEKELSDALKKVKEKQE